MRICYRLCALLFVSIFFASCATERHIAPTISGPKRSGLALEKPILGAVLDGRATQEPKDAASILQRDLNSLYASSIQWCDYFSEIPAGQVGVRIRIVTLGATFGNRLISSSAYMTAIGAAQGHASGPWGSVVSSATAEQSAIASSFTGEG